MNIKIFSVNILKLGELDMECSLRLPSFFGAENAGKSGDKAT